MSAVRLCMLGAGSVRCSVPVIVTLATFFGERPFEISMYDSDEERLDLFDRFARLCFAVTHSTHQLISTPDPAEALDAADKVILQVGPNCAKRLLRREAGDRDVEDAMSIILPLIPLAAEVISLMPAEITLPDSYDRLDWPKPLEADQRQAIPFSVIRLLNGEDFLNLLIKEHADSPLRPWLEQHVLR